MLLRILTFYKIDLLGHEGLRANLMMMERKDGISPTSL
jgi:hypothetical protein